MKLLVCYFVGFVVCADVVHLDSDLTTQFAQNPSEGFVMFRSERKMTVVKLPDPLRRMSAFVSRDTRANIRHS